VSVDCGGDEVSIRFQDNGSGVQAEETAQLLEKFHRGSNSTRIPGSGLGLSICKGIVEAHGGSLSVESGAGNGFAVIVRLPRSSRRSE
jgi:two-component system sensor histidine kinase KdpD